MVTSPATFELPRLAGGTLLAAALSALVVLASGIGALPACNPFGGGCAHYDFIITPANTLQIFGIASRSWADGTPTPLRRYGVRAMSLNGWIYAFVGANAIRYDPGTDPWVQLPDSTVPVAAADVVPMGLDICVIRSNGSGPTERELFDTISETWSSSTPTGAAHSAAVGLGGA